MTLAIIGYGILAVAVACALFALFLFFTAKDEDEAPKIDTFARPDPNNRRR